MYAAARDLRFVRKYSTDGASACSRGIIVATAERHSYRQWCGLHASSQLLMAALGLCDLQTKGDFPARLWIRHRLSWPLVIVTRITPPINEWLLCLLLGFDSTFRQLQKGAAAKCAALVGAYSYAIHLLHQPLLWLCFRRASAPPIRWAAFAIVSVLPGFALSRWKRL